MNIRYKKYLIFLCFLLIIVMGLFIFFKKHIGVKQKNVDDQYSFVIKESGHGKIKIEKWKIDIPETAYSTGPFFQLQENLFLVANRIGEIYITTINENSAYSHQVASIDLGPKNPKRIDTNGVDVDDSGIKDIKVSGGYIFLSATRYYPKKSCYTLLLYSGSFLNGHIENLKPFWESKPACISGSPSIAGELGGKIAVVDKNKLLLAVGGGGVDTLVVDQKSNYGKVLEIIHDRDQLIKINNYTYGHRNPSGIWYDELSDRVFETEHGPSGGDELNILVRGGNYGWPYVTYGYESHEKSPYMVQKNEFTHQGYDAPLYAFIPSIGVSGVAIMKRNNEFPMWSGDLFVGSLSGTNNSGMSIYRIHSDKDHPNLLERIEIGERIRGINITEKGTIYFKTDFQHIGRITRVIENKE